MTLRRTFLARTFLTLCVGILFAIANNQWSKAIEYHLLAPFVVTLWVVSLVQVSFELLTKRVWSHWWQRRNVWYGSLLLMFGHHGFRLYRLWSSGGLAADMQQSFLSHLF